MWANWHMMQWDTFIEKSEFARTHCLITSTALTPVFKKPHSESYSLYRAYMELIDCAVLDVQSLAYNVRALVAALAYVLLGKQFGQFTDEQIAHEFPASSHYLLDTGFAFNNLYAHFLESYSGLPLCGILPTIQYCSTYFALPLHVELPVAAKVDRKNVLEGHFEEFLAYQTHNPHNVAFLTNVRNRGA